MFDIKIFRYLYDQLQYKFEMPGSSDSLFIDLKLEAKEDVCMLTLLFS